MGAVTWRSLLRAVIASPSIFFGSFVAHLSLLWGSRILALDDVLLMSPGYELVLYLFHGHEFVLGGWLFGIGCAFYIALIWGSHNWWALFWVNAALCWGLVSVSLVLYSPSPLGWLTYFLIAVYTFAFFLFGSSVRR